MTKPVHHALVADLVAPSVVRRLFRDWLTELRWPSEETDDLVLAASEAVSNTVDHAYPNGSPGDVLFEARCEIDEVGRRVVIVVSDHGAWRPQPIWHEHRRRGLQLMRACTGALEVDATANGTRVRMVSRSVQVGSRGPELAQS